MCPASYWHGNKKIKNKKVDLVAKTWKIRWNQKSLTFWLSIGDHIIRHTRRYGPLKGPTSSSCGKLLTSKASQPKYQILSIPNICLKYCVWVMAFCVLGYLRSKLEGVVDGKKIQFVDVVKFKSWTFADHWFSCF